MASQNSGRNREVKSPLSVRERLAGGVSVFALALFCLGIGLLALNLQLGDTSWARAVFLLQGIETITFAGVGWLFGREVTRQEAKGQALAESARAANGETVAAGGVGVQTAIPDDEARIRLAM